MSIENKYLLENKHSAENNYSIENKYSTENNYSVETKISYAETAKEFIETLPYRQGEYAGRNWGHPWHSLCSYHGKLKPAIAHFLVKRFTNKGDIVLDPLCGVGTIPFLTHFLETMLWIIFLNQSFEIILFGSSFWYLPLTTYSIYRSLTLVCCLIIALIFYFSFFYKRQI